VVLTFDYLNRTQADLCYFLGAKRIDEIEITKEGAQFREGKFRGNSNRCATDMDAMFFASVLHGCARTDRNRPTRARITGCNARSQGV
jgi:hypothetical protein